MWLEWSLLLLFFFWIIFFCFLCCMCSDCDAIFRRSVCKRERSREDRGWRTCPKANRQKDNQQQFSIITPRFEAIEKGLGLGKGEQARKGAERGKRWSTQSCLSEALGPLLNLAELSSMHFKENHYYRCGKRMKKRLWRQEDEGPGSCLSVFSRSS